MFRHTVRGVMGSGLLLALVASTGLGQPGSGPEKVTYRSKGEVKTIDGEVKMTADGVQVSTGGKVLQVISPADIIRVLPADVPGVDRSAVFTQQGNEDRKEYDKARLGYTELRAKATGLNEKGKKFLDYRIASNTARLADEAEDDAAWRGLSANAVKSLQAFCDTYQDGWEIWNMGRTLARFQLQLGNFESAAKTWGKLARNPAVPAPLKLEAGMQQIEALICSNQGADAVGKVADLAKVPNLSATAKERLAVYQAAAEALAKSKPDEGVPALQKVIDSTKDPLVRGTGFVMLAELYRAAGKTRDAMWSYFWVEVVYNQDKDEVLVALYRLGQIFQDQGDEERAKIYKEKLRKYGTVYGI